MAFTDIITPQGNSAVLYFNRGNIGTLSDIVALTHNMLFFPEGAGSGAVFPDPTDVDSGVQYGQTGVEYTGTLEQPAEADVKTGVLYGGDGNEFEGSYSGSGTGSIFINID